MNGKELQEPPSANCDNVLLVMCEEVRQRRIEGGEATRHEQRRWLASEMKCSAVRRVEGGGFRHACQELSPTSFATTKRSGQRDLMQQIPI